MSIALAQALASQTRHTYIKTVPPKNSIKPSSSSSREVLLASQALEPASKRVIDSHLIEEILAYLTITEIGRFSRVNREFGVTKVGERIQNAAIAQLSQLKFIDSAQFPHYRRALRAPACDAGFLNHCKNMRTAHLRLFRGMEEEAFNMTTAIPSLLVLRIDELDTDLIAAIAKGCPRLEMLGCQNANSEGIDFLARTKVLPYLRHFVVTPYGGVISEERADEMAGFVNRRGFGAIVGDTARYSDLTEERALFLLSHGRLGDRLGVHTIECDQIGLEAVSVLQQMPNLRNVMIRNSIDDLPLIKELLQLKEDNQHIHVEFSANLI